jgi:2-polyprenyl-3-methyl-5-hydroxy-6-metoxy-1,4-benzoquinol methylase
MTSRMPTGEPAVEGLAPLSRAEAVALVRQASPAHSPAAACAACSSTGTAPVTWQDGFRIAECGDCGFLWVDPMPSPAAIWEYYNRRTFKPYPDDMIKAKFAPTLSVAAAVLPSGGRVLDVGCNHGHFAHLLREKGFQAEGADVDGTALAYAAEHYGLTVYHGDLADLDLPARFDAITILSSIEHTAAPFAVMTAAYRSLRPGGLLMISTPRGDGLIPLVSRKLFMPALGTWELLSPPSHLTFFTHRSLTAMLHRAGFRADSFHYQARTRAYKRAELQETLRRSVNPPHWARLLYPRLHWLIEPARWLGRGDLTICVAVKPADQGTEARS